MIINYIIIIVIKNGDFLTEDIIKSFNNKEEAEILLEKSRNRIDEIDNELMDLISQRTSLAKDIVLAKDYLGIPIYDESRENQIHKKIRELSEEKTSFVKRLAKELIETHKGVFTTDFEENKKLVQEYSTVSTKHLRNKIAGYVTRLVRLEQTQE